MSDEEHCPADGEGGDTLAGRRDRWFDPYRSPRTDNARALVHSVLSALEDHETQHGLRQKARRPKDRENHEAMVGAVVSDLAYNHLVSPGRAVAITRSGMILRQPSRYRPGFMGKTLPATLDALERLAWISQVKGKPGQSGGHRTTVAPGTALLQAIAMSGLDLSDFGQRSGRGCIILRRPKWDYWDDGGRMEYADTAEVRNHRNRLSEINEWIGAAAISLTQAAVDAGAADAGQRQLRRFFTRGSFTSGGRLFGGFWQPLNKDLRRQSILIDGRLVVGLDFGQMTPRIAYGLEGSVPPSKDDAYRVAGIEPWDIWRDGVKKLMNAMLFAEKPFHRKPKGLSTRLPNRPVGDLNAAITETHPAIAHRFFTGFGHEAQFIESEIMVEVLLRLKGQGIVALPVHDAVVVAETSVDRADQTMRAVFQEMTGLEAIISREH